MSHTKHTRPHPIPDVEMDLKSIYDAVQSLKVGYEGLSRQRGHIHSWPVTFGDLIDLGIITAAQADDQLQRRRV